MPWFHKRIEDPAAAYAESGLYEPAMEALYRTPGTADAAIFSRLDPLTGAMHFYFTPAAESVARNFRATPCPQPPRADIGSRLIGDETLLDRLFGP